jgi:hypothetical protein
MAKFQLTTISSNNWYIAYVIGDKVESLPVLFWVILYDAEKSLAFPDLQFYPVVWDRIAQKIIDGRSIVGFRGIVRKLEANRVTDEAMLRDALKASTNISDIDINGLVETAVSKTLAQMIADRTIQNALAQALPPPI